MLIHAFRRGAQAERAKLKASWERRAASGGSMTLRGSEALMERYGSLDYARKIGHGLAGAALHEFARIFGRLPPSRDKDFLRGLITWIFERT